MPRPTLSAIPDTEEEMVPWLVGRQLAQESLIQRLEGRLESDSSAVTALTNGYRDMGAKVDANTKALGELKATIVQLTAIPGAGLANILAASVEGNGSGGTGALIATLVTLAIPILLPRLAKLRGSNGGGNGLG